MAQTFLQPKFVGTTNKLLQFDNAGVLQAVDVTISGILPQIVVMTETGSQVTCNKDGVTLTATEQSGKWVFNVPTKGSWTCSVLTPGGEAASDIVNVLETKQYKVTIEITPASTVDPILDNNDWTTIQAIAQASEGSTYWSVGDTKEITLLSFLIPFWDYNPGTMTLSAVIIGFDHNSTLEGTGITFQLGRYNDTDVSLGKTGSFADQDRGVRAIDNSFSASNSWVYSYLRHYCGSSLQDGTSFINCLPLDLRAVLKPIIKYTDNTGYQNGSAGSASDVTSTIDLIFVPALFEITGSVMLNMNPYEANYQQQYAYYNGINTFNRAVVIHNSQTGTTYIDSTPPSSTGYSYWYWWTRTCNKSSSTAFYAMGAAPYSFNGRNGAFIAPCFVVG